MPPRYPDAVGKQITKSDVSGENLGERIRTRRKAAGLTLDVMAETSGISRAALSKIERGEMSPTYESLLKVAHGLKTDLAALLSRPEAPGDSGFALTRAGEGAKYRQAQFTHEFLGAKFPNRKLHAFITDVPSLPLSDYGTWHSHDSEDFLYVLSGAVLLHLEGHEPIELHAGDSVQMDGRIAHAVIAKPNGRKHRHACSGSACHSPGDDSRQPRTGAAASRARRRYAAALDWPRAMSSRSVLPARK